LRSKNLVYDFLVTEPLSGIAKLFYRDESSIPLKNDRGE